MPIERKLAAIMFTDIAGYTASMSKSESKSLDLLEKKRSILKPLIKEYKGTFVKEIGDGTLSYFESAVNAATCAVKLQEQTYDDDDMNIRAGIHIGDIVFKDGDVFGDGVNVASRLENIAPQGGVCVSKNVYDELLNQDGFDGVELGLQSLKGVGRLVEVFGLKGSKLKEPNPQEYKETEVQVHSDDEVPSIAIIPFVNKGADEDVFYAYGISSDLISDIASAGVIRVSSLTEVEELGDLSFKEKAKKLNTRYVSNGSLWRMGEQFQLSIELYDINKSKVVWSDRWQEKWENLVSIKQKLSESLLKTLNTHTPALQPNINNNVEAYELYLKGKFKIDKPENPDDFNIGVELIDRAISLDKNLIDARLLKMKSCGMTGDFDKFVDICKDTIQITEESNQTKYLPLIYRLKGIQIFMQHTALAAKGGSKVKETLTDDILDEILDCFSKSSDIAKKANDIKGYATSKFMNAIVYRFQDNFLKEIEVMQEAVGIFKEIDDQEGLSHVYFEIGNTYKDLGDYVKSLHYNQKGLDIVEKKHLIREVLLFSNIIEIKLIANNNLEDADLEDLSEQCDKLLSSYGHELVVANSIYVYKALTKFRQKKYSSVVDILEESKAKIADSLDGNIFEQAQILLMLARKYQEQDLNQELIDLEKEIQLEGYKYPYWMGYYVYKLFGKEKGNKYLSDAVDDIKSKQGQLEEKAVKEFSESFYVRLVLKEWEKVSKSQP